MIEVLVFNDSKYKRTPKSTIKVLIERIFKREKIKKAHVNVVYVDDEKIKIINKKFLNHHRATDVISFNLNEDADILGEIYISLETAEKQAEEYGGTFTDEVKRLAIHGALHLVGYDDASNEGKEVMTNLENYYLKSE